MGEDCASGKQPSAIVMAEHLGAQRKGQSSFPTNIDNTNNPNSEMMAATSNEQEVILNINGFQISKTMLKELLKRSIGMANVKTCLQPCDIDLIFENEDIGYRTKILNLLSQTLNCDEPRPVMAEQSRKNIAPVDVDRSLQNALAYRGNADVRGCTLPVVQQDGGAENQQSSDLEYIVEHLVEKLEKHIKLTHSSLPDSHDGRCPVSGNEPPRAEIGNLGKERTGRDVGSHPISEQGTTGENRKKEELNVRRKFRERKTKSRHAIRSTQAEAETSEVEPMTATSDEISARLLAEICMPITTRKPPQQKGRSQGANQQAHVKKNSTLQARMDVGRSSSQQISNPAEVVQFPFKVQSSVVGGAAGSSASEHSVGVEAVESEGEHEKRAEDGVNVGIGEHNQLGEVSNSSQPSPTPSHTSGRADTKSAAVPQNRKNQENLPRYNSRVDGQKVRTGRGVRKNKK